jgi:hypothetical protein
MSSKKELFILTAVLLSPGALRAHESPIHPVEVQLKVYPRGIHMTLDSNQCYWFAEVLKLDAEPAMWMETFNGPVKKYVDEHFKLTLDGVPLESRMLGVHWAQNPWQNHQLGRLIFQFSYSLPPQGGRRLEGSATFFSELAAEDKDEVYETHLDVPGRKHTKLSLPLSAPHFELSLAEATRTPLRERLDLWWDQFINRGFYPFVTVLALVLLYFAVSGPPRRWVK